jgi:ribonuclease HI
VIHIDGASRGNPGQAGAGVWLASEEGKKIGEISRYLGHKTNNEAEYWALLLGLREARRLGGDSIRVFTDSELIARQVKGLYRVKDSKLRGLYQAVLEDLKGFSSFEIESIPREENREADRLAKRAINEGMKRRKEEVRRGRDGRSSASPAEREKGGEESPSSTGQGGP